MLVGTNMNPTPSHDEPLQLDRNADLETVLAAWHSATLRLEQTHEALRCEVQRLTDELEEKNRELARENRLADLGRMAAHIAHEVRNNLVPVTLYLSLLKRRIAGDTGSLDLLGKMEAGFTALDATVNDLLNFTSDRDPHRRTFSVRGLLDDIVMSLAPQLTAQGIRTETQADDRVQVHADRGMLRRALLNLVLNAVDAMPDGGRLLLSAERSGQGVEIRVADSGAGMSEEARSRAFEPFFTTKPGGTGLGLAIVYRVAEVHGGRIVAEECREGAVFCLTLPDVRQEAAA
jgi:signal transduction histidine kinase